MVSDGGEGSGVCFPRCDSSVVFATVFVVDDEWDNLVAQAFLHHDQSAEAAVSVFKGMDTLEPDMEVQDVSQLHFFLGLIFLN